MCHHLCTSSQCLGYCTGIWFKEDITFIALVKLYVRVSGSDVGSDGLSEKRCVWKAAHRFIAVHVGQKKRSSYSNCCSSPLYRHVDFPSLLLHFVHLYSFDTWWHSLARCLVLSICTIFCKCIYSYWGEKKCTWLKKQYTAKVSPTSDFRVE